jgi:hypothetical protein
MNMRQLALWLGAGGFALIALAKLLEWPTSGFGLNRARFATFVEFLGFALLAAATLLFALSKT